MKRYKKRKKWKQPKKRFYIYAENIIKNNTLSKTRFFRLHFVADSMVYLQPLWGNWPHVQISVK